MAKCKSCRKTFIKKRKSSLYCSRKCLYDFLRGKELSRDHRTKLALAKLGKKQSPESVQNRLSWNKGYKWRKETIEKRANSNRNKRREGAAYQNILEGIARRHGYSSYKEFPKSVRKNRRDWNIARKLALKRDNYTCQKCRRTERLQVHHLVDFKKTQDNLLSNLITLCIYCHQGLKGSTNNV
jgi:ribosomal protein L37AE/L43A